MVVDLVTLTAALDCARDITRFTGLGRGRRRERRPEGATMDPRYELVDEILLTSSLAVTATDRSISRQHGPTVVLRVVRNIGEDGARELLRRR